MLVPTVASVVVYRLTAADVAAINRRREDAKAFLAAMRDEGETGRKSKKKSDTEDDLRIPGDGAVRHIGNDASEGDAYPLVITRVHGDTAESCVNGQVMLDGNDNLWVTSVAYGEGPGTFSWPGRG